jgi:hypothetical protein
MASSYYPKIVTSGMVLYLDAGNRDSYAGSGTTWRDLSGNGRNGTLVNSPTFSGANVGSLAFNGTTQYVDSIGGVSDFSFIQNTAVYTICGWVKLSSLNTDVYFIGNNDGASASKGFFLGVPSSSNTSANLVLSRGTAGSWTLSHTVTNFFTDFNWVNITCVGNGSNNQFYRNGTAFSTSQVFNATSSGDSLRPLGLARINSYSSYYWPGNISNVSIYNRALSAAEVLQNFNAMRGRFRV